MGYLTPEEEKAVSNVLATLVLARGRKIPEYIASLEPAERATVIEALSNFSEIPMDNEFKAALYYTPELVTRLIETNPALGAMFDLLGERARNTIAEWDTEELKSGLKNVGYHANPAQNARYN